jgi:hypothetical protein
MPAAKAKRARTMARGRKTIKAIRAKRKKRSKSY